VRRTGKKKKARRDWCRGRGGSEEGGGKRRGDQETFAKATQLTANSKRRFSNCSFS
jgi:hypothetical protein